MAFKGIPREFKLIVAGGRDYWDYERMHAKLFDLAEEAGNGIHISIVSGMARGADALGLRLAKEENVKYYEFPADWNTHGKVAGHIRNRQMGDFADGLLAYWDGRSRGTKHMIDYMVSLGKPVIIERY